MKCVVRAVSSLYKIMFAYGFVPAQLVFDGEVPVVDSGKQLELDASTTYLKQLSASFVLVDVILGVRDVEIEDAILLHLRFSRAAMDRLSPAVGTEYLPS